ncbi:hypothetical protein OIE67_51030 [Nonomuraea fuscirosea]|uniref:hypothetical protein n=1 Tax=Nonomuraea fuscirosea TaxID=1291556 RepID=UPI002DDC0C6C|nr:hypothetical protein [Nonomuraea fuscirosea]WSA52279.1 hypothetical protein OIE67_51030 [Nonomuraea fuscirosea]
MPLDLHGWNYRQAQGRMGYGVVGRPGLEPGTYGLKVDSFYAERCLPVFNYVALSNFTAFEMSENVGAYPWVPMAEEHVMSTRPRDAATIVRS